MNFFFRFTLFPLGFNAIPDIIRAFKLEDG